MKPKRKPVFRYPPRKNRQGVALDCKEAVAGKLLPSYVLSDRLIGWPHYEEGFLIQERGMVNDTRGFFLDWFVSGLIHLQLARSVLKDSVFGNGCVSADTAPRW